MTNDSAAAFSESDFRSLWNAIDASQAIVAFSDEGQIISVNENFLKVFGYEAEELVGGHHSLLCPPEVAESQEYWKFWNSLFRGEITSGEFRRIDKLDNTIWLRATFFPVRSEKGKVTKIIKTAIDVTAEVEKRAADKGKLSAIYRSQAVVEFDVTGRIIDANENFCRTMGYTQTEVIDKHHAIFCEREYAESEKYRAFWRRLGAGEFVVGEFKRRSKNGDDIWIQATYNPIFDATGAPTKIIKFATDITQSKTRNVETDAKMNAINRSQAVVEFDVNGTIIGANDNFLRVMGYTLSEISGKHHAIFCDPESIKSEAYSEFWYRLSKGEFFSGRFMRISKYGRQVWIQATYNPILSVTGEVLKVVKFATDITGQVELEQRIREEALGITETISSMRASVNEEVATTRKADELAKSTKMLSNSGASSIAESIETIKGIETSADEIATIVETIDEIAQQTNMLAFNAAIEAARAGEHGYGFTVVAEEVRRLAERSGDATKEIAGLISKTAEQVKRGSKVASEAATAFDKINLGIDDTSGVIAEIVAATDEQLISADRVGMAVDRLVEAVEAESSTSGQDQHLTGRGGGGSKGEHGKVAGANGKKPSASEAKPKRGQSGKDAAA
ncbi:MAG: PAS domain-containing methyl-accepting chemotaxis protein [Pseudomonadota bacterium]